MDGVKDQLSNTIDNFTVTYIKSLTWNGVPAREIAYTGTSSGYAVAIIQRLCVKKRNLFVMTYTAEGEKDDTYVEAARLMFTKLIIR